MALIKCVECGKEISDAAEKCPHCGKELNIIKLNEEGSNKMSSKPFAIILVIAVVVIIGLVIGLIMTNSKLTKCQTKIDSLNREREDHISLLKERQGELNQTKLELTKIKTHAEGLQRTLDSKKPVTVLENAQFEIKPSYHQSYTIPIKVTSLIDIKVVESFGANIDFKVLQDGKQIFYSGIHKGGTQASITVSPGDINLVIMNDNMVDKKNGRVTVIVRPID